MIRSIATVGGFTLLSRITGFFRDVVLAAVLGAGPLADAFFVAFRLPNHFRAILAEGAFNAAFVPAYARELEQAGQGSARAFADRIAAALLLVNVVVLAFALVFTPELVTLLAHGLSDDPDRFHLAVTLTRITFPALLLVSLQTLISGELNAHSRFATAAGAPILLNICMIAALGLSYWFPTPGHAAAWSVLAAGVLQVLLVGFDAERHGFGLRLRLPVLDQPTRRFLKALGPAIIGAGGVQLALFADTLIASFLPAGALSALYYADRVNQLPIGVVGIAVGIVLLPEMSRRLAAGDDAGAASAQSRGIQLALLLTLPVAVAALVVPELIMRALFGRGAFTAEDAAAAGATLAAYAIGLIPFTLMRSFSAPFFARGDTMTPVIAALVAAGINIGLKFALMGSLAQVGLALATAVGAWINLVLLSVFARRQGFALSARALGAPIAKLLIATALLGAMIYGATLVLPQWLVGVTRFRDEVELGLLVLLGAIVYAGAILLLLGRSWLRSLMRDAGSGPLTATGLAREEEAAAISSLPDGDGSPGGIEKP